MDRKYRLAYMSSSDFGIPAFRALLTQPEYEVVGLVTQPDKPSGRGGKVTPLPIKRVAAEHSVPVLQPARLRDPEAIREVQALHPDVIVVAAYGQWIPAAIYAMPPFGTLNIHPSLLPRHRGAAPAMSTLLSGDEETGVTIILVVEEMDAGDILEQRRVKVDPEDTTGTLMARLAELGAQMIVELLPRWFAGEVDPRPQDHSQATYLGRVKKERGHIDWNRPAEEIWREVRAFNPWPSAYTFFRDKRLVIHRARPLHDWAGRASPGTMLLLPEGLAVATGKGALLLLEVQLEGKRAMSAEEFARGQRDLEGVQLE